MNRRLFFHCLLFTFCFFLLFHNAFAGNNRGEREAEIRNKFEWVIFGGEYHAYQLLLVGLDTAFGSGGQITKEFALEEAKKLGVDLASELANQTKKGPLVSGIMTFEIWERPSIGGFSKKISLGNKFVPYIGVLKDTQASADTRVPDGHGYKEFHRRMEEAWSGRETLPPIGETVEGKWIRYLASHCVGNRPNRDGYKEFRRRLDLAYQLRFAPDQFNANYSGKPNLDVETVPPAFDRNTTEGKALSSLITHCIGNGPGEDGYKEWHRRVAEELLPQHEAELKNRNSADAVWLLYTMQHLAGNFPFIER